MPIDPQDGGPDDWFVPAGDGYPDDWFVPTSDGYPDDWFVPTSAAPGAPEPASDPQRSTANPALTAQPVPRPDPLAPFWASIPASRADAMAWRPPIFLNSARQSSPTAPAPADSPWIDPTRALPGAFVNPLAPNVPTYAPFGATADPRSAKPDAFSFLQSYGLASGNSGQPALPPLFSSLAKLSGSPPPDGSDTAGDMVRQFAFLDGVPFGARPSDRGTGFTPPMLNSPSANPSALPFIQTADPTAGTSDRPARQSLLPDVSDADQSAFSTRSPDVVDESAGSHSSASQANLSESGSITRVVRDSTGRALAIIHVQQEPSAAARSGSVSDATPDALRPGSRYAQVNNAVTGHPVIDRTTDMLLAVLQRSIQEMGSGSGPLFGVRVHADFANRVRQLDLPGIGQDGVEQSYHIDAVDFVRYGLDGSIRTDIALRDPRNPNQGPIAVYDLKTGNAVLTPSRVEEIRRVLRQPDLPVIMLHYRTGDAVTPPRRTPEQ
jgi:hypothetical protein